MLPVLRPLLGIPRLRIRWNQIAPDFLDYRHTAGNSTAQITDKLSRFYFGSSSDPEHILEPQIVKVSYIYLFI